MKALLGVAALLLAGCPPVDDYYVKQAPPPDKVEPGRCGDSLRQVGEDCDGADLQSKTCADFGGTSGTLACTSGCAFDTSGCASVPAPRCGDGKLDGSEACEGENLAQKSCKTEGFDSGELACSSTCELDTSGCEDIVDAPPRCGDDVANGDEACDGPDLDQRDCESEGFDSGTLRCTVACKLDVSDCVDAPVAVCGDGVATDTEACDEADLRAGSCPEQGFSGGVLACDSDCTLDTSGCIEGPSCDFDGGSRTGVVLREDTALHTSSVRTWSCTAGGSGPDVSVAWTAPATGCYQVFTTSDRDLDTILGVFEDCALADELACDDNGGADQYSRLEFEAVAGTTYAFVTDSYFASDTGPLQVRVSPCAPPEWTCEPATFGRGDGCDCGCGVADFDCDGDSTVDACTFCDAAGSCAEGESCSSIRDDENWACD